MPDTVLGKTSNSQKKIKYLVKLWILLLFCYFPIHAQKPIAIDHEHQSVLVSASFHPDHYNRTLGLKNHHLAVWQGGSAAKLALFEVFAPDSEVYDSLVSLGATPGNNLTANTWNSRFDDRVSDPDQHVTGTTLHLDVLYKDSVYSLDRFIVDAQAKPVDLRFGGNRSLIRIFRSGCVVCLQSCPGGKVGNATWTIRDLIKHRCSFTLAKNAPVPADSIFVMKFTITNNPK